MAKTSPLSFDESGGMVLNLDSIRLPSPRPPASPTLVFDPVLVAHRNDGWTPQKQIEFIEALAECGVVGEAAGRVGMTEQTARRLRARADAASFRTAWSEAVRIAGDRLKSVAFDRAVNGTVRRRYYRGQVIDEERVYDNRLLTYLLGKLDFDRSESFDSRNFLAAADHGLPLPAVRETGAPVWQNENGWFTNFPPPEGFDGDQDGDYGDPDYWRELTEEEQAQVEASIAARRAEATRARDLFFDRLK